MFAGFSAVEATPVKTIYDTKRLPPRVAALVPDALGWFITLRATK